MKKKKIKTTIGESMEDIKKLKNNEVVAPTDTQRFTIMLLFPISMLESSPLGLVDISQLLILKNNSTYICMPEKKTFLHVELTSHTQLGKKGSNKRSIMITCSASEFPPTEIPVKIPKKKNGSEETKGETKPGSEDLLLKMHFIANNKEPQSKQMPVYLLSQKLIKLFRELGYILETNALHPSINPAIEDFECFQVTLVEICILRPLILKVVDGPIAYDSIKALEVQIEIYNMDPECD